MATERQKKMSKRNPTIELLATNKNGFYFAIRKPNKKKEAWGTFFNNYDLINLFLTNNGEILTDGDKGEVRKILHRQVGYWLNTQNGRE